MTKRLTSTCLLGSDSDFAPQLVFHPSGFSLAVVGLEKDCLSLVDCSSGTVNQSLPVTAEPGGVAFDTTGEYLMAVCHDCVWIWEFVDNKPKQYAIPNTAQYDLYSSSPAFSAGDNGVWVLFANEWQLWSLAEKRILLKMRCPKGERLLGLARTPSGASEAVTYDEQSVNHAGPTVSVWDLEGQRCTRVMSLDNWQDVIVSPNLEQAVMRLAGAEDSISLWNLRTGSKLGEVRGMFSSSRHAFYADNSHFVSCVPSDAAIPWTWVAVTDFATGRQQFIDPGVPFPPTLISSPYISLFATIANDNRHPVDVTAFWDPITGEQFGWTSGHAGLSPASCFSPCGGWFATAVDINDLGFMVDAVPKGSVTITAIRRLTSR